MKNNNEKFDEDALEEAFIDHLKEKDFIYSKNEEIPRSISDVIIENDLKDYLIKRYSFTSNQIKFIKNTLKNISNSDLYASNKEIYDLITSGLYVGKESTEEKIFTQLIDFDNPENNVYRFINQFEVKGIRKRIPDIVVFINGLPLIVIEFKSAMREETNIFDAYNQIVARYQRDIPELFKYNMFSVISDGVNTKIGTVFSDYEYFYTWKDKNNLNKTEVGFSSLINFTEGLMDTKNLLMVLENFIYFPDKSSKKEKFFCRYPQYYGATALHKSILENKQPEGDGKGGTYFGATGSGKSLTMLYLTKLLTSEQNLKNPSIVILSDRTDLDDQISQLFLNSKNFIGDNNVINVETRKELKEQLTNIKSGGVFLTTIQKFNKDTGLLSDRDNIICISDEAHRTQLNTENKLKISNEEVHQTYSFGKAIRNSFPSATYVGFTGTPIDETLSTFGDITDSYTLEESVVDGITTSIFYEGRNIKVKTDSQKLEEIEEYYEKCLIEGSNEYQVNESKKAMSKLNSILGNPERLKLLSEDFIDHYEKRLEEGSYDSGKVMIVCSQREIAYDLYKLILLKRPSWGKKAKSQSSSLKKSKDRIEKIKLVITRDKDDPKGLFDTAGNKKYRKELDRLFKDDESNFKIAIVVDMWITGFDVPSLEGIYIDKPIREHTLIQTISRVNRVYKNKDIGLVVDYIGIKNSMNLALKKYTKGIQDDFKDVEDALDILQKHLYSLDQLCLKKNPKNFTNMSSKEKFKYLNEFSEYIQSNEALENSFMSTASKLKSTYKICSSNESISIEDRGKIHAYLAARSMILKLTKGDAPDVSMMNNEVSRLVEESLISKDIDEIFKMSKNSKTIDIFDSKNLEIIAKIELPNSKLKTLQRLLDVGIKEISKINKVKSIDFTKKFQKLVDSYNNRNDIDILKNNLLEDLTEQFTSLIFEINEEISNFKNLGVGYEEKTYFDILNNSIIKYEFEYEEKKLISLSKNIKKIIDKVSINSDWSNREDLKAQIKVDLTLLLEEYNFPPGHEDEIFNQVLIQAKSYSSL